MGIQTELGIIVLEKDEILLAFEEPNSLLFYIDPLYDPSRKLKGYAFIGGGFGHAVGLSQYGSYHLGKNGYSFFSALNGPLLRVELGRTNPLPAAVNVIARGAARAAVSQPSRAAPPSQEGE